MTPEELKNLIREHRQIDELAPLPWAARAAGALGRALGTAYGAGKAALKMPDAPAIEPVTPVANTSASTSNVSTVSTTTTPVTASSTATGPTTSPEPKSAGLTPLADKKPQVTPGTTPAPSTSLPHTADSNASDSKPLVVDVKKRPDTPSKDQSFSQAFRAAREKAGNGNGRFTWKGKEYQTNVAGEKYIPRNKQTPVGEETMSDAQENRLIAGFLKLQETQKNSLVDNPFADAQEITEISKKTLGSYVGRAAQSLGAAAWIGGIEHGKYIGRGDIGPQKDGSIKTRSIEKDGSDEEKEENRRRFNRERGIKLAGKKLAKEEVEETGEQIDEISVQKAGKYISAAQSDKYRARTDKDGNYTETEDQQDRRRKNRTDGLTLAARKVQTDYSLKKNNLTPAKVRATENEEVELSADELARLDEISKNLATSYMHKAASEKNPKKNREDGVIRALDKKYGGAKVPATDK